MLRNNVGQGKGIDIHATGLGSATAEWPLVGAVSDAREHAILRARKLGSPAAVADTLPPWPLLLLGVACGVLGPVLASWFVVAPLKGTPIAAGWVPHRMLASLLINGFWGIGLVLIYAGLRRWASRPRQAQAA